VIVVLNKINSHHFDLNRRGLLNKYPGRIQEFVQTDCETGTGIATLQEAILHVIHTLPHLRARFPIAWFAIKDHLSTMEDNFISFDRYRELCSALGETDERAQEVLAYALHCLGIALNYRDDPRLREHHVLNPHWVTKGIYGILNSGIAAGGHGEVGLMDLASILDKTAYPRNMHPFLLGLMRRFELCFRFPDPKDDRYLIPQLLGKEQPVISSHFSSGSLRFMYSYPIWPEGLIPRFIVRTHSLSVAQPRWRTGVVLEFEGNRALIKGDPEEKTVSISITGPLEGRRRLLAVIRSDFERIHADIRGLRPIASVPLDQNGGGTISYDVLRTFEQQGVQRFPHVIGNKVISVEVHELLNSVELPTAPAGTAVNIFISYSHKDDALRGELDTHLKLFQRVGLVDTWHDRRLSPGDDWRSQIDRQLDGAEVVLFLVSADFLASDYCFDIEATRALRRHRAGNAIVVPIIVRDCVWQDAPFSYLQVLPDTALPVRLWPDRDSAWKNVAEGVRRAIVRLRPGTVIRDGEVVEAEE
jgi:internalin A